MSITSKTMSLSKEMSVEESFSKQTSSISSSVMSSTMESSIQSSSSLLSSAMGDLDSGMSSLVSKIDSDLAIMDSGKDIASGLKMSSVEKSSSVMESENSFVSKKLESTSSIDIQESSKSMSMSSTKEEISMSKSESVSEQKSLTKSESISSEISEEKPCIYVAVMDYSPRSGDSEGLSLSEGQEVEVIDSSRAHKWRVRLRKDGTEGTVASCYLEKKEIVTPVMSPQLDPKAQATKARREKILKELIESEEAFSRDMQYVVDNYIRELELKTTPKELRDYKDVLFTNFKAISEFHNNVLMKGIQYYADDPARLGKTFLRLERDFDMHVAYCRDEPEAQHVIQSGPLKEYFDNFSKKLEDEKSLSEHLKLPIQRINDYQLLLKELIKYTTRLREDTTDLEKAHDFMQAIPQRITDLQYINSIQGYKGNLHKLGRILKHDWFEVTDCNNLRRERFLFLFKGRIFVTDQKRVGSTRSIYLVKNVIKLPEMEIVDNADDDDFKLRFQSLKNAPGFPLTIKSKTTEQKEEWLGAIQLSSGPHVEDLGDDELDMIEDQAVKVEEFYEKHETKVEVVEDFEAYEEMQTIITESVRSGSLTSLEDFQSALDDEPSLCLTASDLETAGPGRPRFTTPLKAHTCAEGVEAILDCEVCATPDVTVAWLKDNSPLASSRRAVLEADGGKHRLLIKKTECADSGLYTIIASNVHGTTSCSAPLTVSSAPGTIPPTKPDGTPMSYGPIFREKLRDTELQEGTDFRVCIIVEGEPKSTLRFYKNDEEIGTEGRVRYNKENDDCYELIIDNVKKEDAAKYSCVAKSVAGQNVTACEISVTRSKVFVTFEEDQDKESTPDLIDNIQWGKDTKEVEVEASEHFEVTTDDTKDTVSLKFKHVTPDDSGIYTCVASTSSGKIQCSAEVTVQGGLLRDPESPKLKAVSKTVDAKEGSSALLELTATGFPKPVITWSKDGEELKLGDKYMLLQEDDETYTMAIKDISQEDSGKYHAEAINDTGKDEVTYDVRVTSPPKFTKQMKDSNVMVGEDIEFSVEIEGSPEPTVSWCKDGQQLVPSDRVKITSDGKTKKLVIKNAQVEDAGNYSCIIKNENGSQGGFGAVQVSSPPKFLKGLSDVNISAGENAEFSVNISGNPIPTLKWVKDGQEIKQDGSRISQRKKGDSSYVLTIKETTSEDIGVYSCEIVNEHGKDTSKGTLKLKEKLSFKKGLKDIQVSEGEDIELEVNITGDPKPTVKWSKDGNDLIIDSEHVEQRKEEADGSLTVVIHQSTTEDSGTYKCTITNSESTETTTSKVTVKEEVISPTFKKELKDMMVIEGETIEFSVKFTGKPKVKWSKDGAELTIDSKHFEYKKEDAEDSLTLILHDARKEDTGKYTCTITNAAGSASTSSELSVSESVKTPTFTKELKDVTIIEGETVEFSVKFSGKPSVKWSKDGAELTIDSKHFEYKKEEAEDSLTLVLHDAKKEDTGKYTCTITNSAGSASTSSKVTVSSDEKAPTFQKGLKDMTVKENETVNFTVKFTGKPKPSVKWEKDGAELTIDSKHLEQKYEEAEDSLTLVLKNAGKEDAGQYTCTISNSAGSEKTSSKLQVTETEKSPSFTKKLKNLSVIEEETVELSVEYDGNPKPTIKWQKDGKDITIDDDHYEVTKKDNTETLIINEVTAEESGDYTCVITNSSGSEETTSKVTVKEATNAAKFVKGLKDQSVKEEQTVKFTVKFSGKPKPTAKWTKDDAELTIDGKHVKSLEEADDSLTVIIQDAKLNDSGKYSCTITNSEGSDTTTSKLTVTESTSSPEFTQKLKDKDVKEGSDAEFTVKFTGKPKPTAKWTFDSAELTIDNTHTELKTEEDGASLTLILHGVTKEDAGKYACIISNSLGSETSTAKLRVSVAPQFVKSLEDIEAEEGGTLKLNVKFEGQPDPTVVWKLNGKSLDIDGKHLKVSIESDDSLTLIVDKVKKEDIGKYSCEITNALGNDSTSGNVNVTGKPVIKKPLESKEVTEGDANVELVVEATGTPAPSIKWFLNGKELTANDVYGIVSDESKGIYKLVLKKVTSEITGEVRFECTNSSGKAECKGTITLLKKPVFLKELTDITICEGDSLKLETSVDGSPKPDVKWYLGKKELSSKDCTISKDGSKPSLEIEESSLEDSGTYICKAKNKVGEASQQATVTVKSRKDTQAPMFITHLYDQTIVVDDAGRLEAKITGKPEPEVKWHRGDEELKDSEKVIIKSDVENNTYTLTLKDLKIEDTAKYICKATNKYGEAQEVAQITIKEPVAPEIEDMENVTVSYGSPARLKAKITGFPKPDVKWLKGDIPLKADDLYQISADSETKRYVVSIKSVKAEEIGTYSCIASNQAGEVRGQATLSIKAQAPVFVRDLKEQSVDIGDQFKFEAEVHGYPTLEITWLKDNKLVECNSHITTSKNGDVYKLEGTVKAVEDAGMFTCKAKNEAGEDSRKAPLKISDFAPKFTEKLPSSVDLVEGEPLNLKAKICGKPAPEIKWLKDGKPLRPSNRIHMAVSPDGTAELSIQDMTHDDAGVYKLVAENGKGQAASETSVGVAFRAKNTKPFVGQLHPIDAIVGKPIILEAKVTGNPQPKIEWTKDGNALESGTHVKLSQGENKGILTIDNATLNDSGEYKLTATNDQGEDNSSAAVTVSAPGRKPTIVKELKAGKLLEGDEGKLQVVVSGQPMPSVAWMHNGRNVMEGEHCTAAIDETGLATLTFHEVKCEDGGMYTAIATNKLGKAVSEAPIIVVPVAKVETEKEKKPLKIFEFLQTLMPQLVPEGKPCLLEAKVTTDPKPVSVKWMKDGKEVPTSERIETTEDSDGTLKLSIPQMTPADKGKYAVIVSDGNTEIKCEALVNMVPSMPGMSGNKPIFIKGLEPVKVGEGETIKLQAQLTPDSKCVIKWMKDGDDVTKNDRTTILEQPNGTIALIIEAAVPEDCGKYVVIATNDEGKTRSSAQVAVVGSGFKLPEIVDSLKPTSFVQGQPGKLTAKIDGEPKPDIKWLKDGSPVEPSDRIKLQRDPDGTVSLEIVEVRPEDAGKYTLLVSNIGGEMRSSANVDVIQSPLFSKSLEPVTGVVDCPAKLECKVSGDPMPEIKWTKDGNEVSDDDPHIRKRQTPSGDVALVFDKCKPENAGDYTCTATNKHGEKACSAPLKVISKDVEGQNKCAPAFVTPLSDLKVQEGDTFKLEATVSGNPIPDVHWFLDDQPLSVSDTILPTFDGKKATLKVYRCNPRHEGVYECKVSNTLGESSSKGKVSVQAHTPPKFIERLSDMQCIANEPMKLVCRLEGCPDPIVEWYFNRNRLDSGMKYSILREGDKCILSIPHPRANDSGLYECRARNEVGKDSCNANIAVSAADTEGEPAMFLKKLKDTSVLNGMSAKLTACICGTPKPEVKWFKDGTQLAEGNRLILEADPNGVIRLIIRGAQKADSGTYRVSISNKFGSDTCTATLGIEGEDKRKPAETVKKEAPKIPTTGPPSPLAHAPYIFKMTDNTASLGWRPSIPSYPQVPFTYRLELCRIPDGQWSTYKSGIKDSSCDVRDLAPGVDYMFRIRVENRYGASEPSPYVTAHRTRLHRPLSPADFAPKDFDLEHLKLDKYAAAPRFLRSDEDSAYAIRGHPARVEFWVYGCPQPKISWFFNNEPVETGKYDFLEDRNGQVILFVTRMGDDDVGMYTCKAVNEHGEAQRKIKLMIAEAPIFTKRLEPQTTMIRKSGEFRCRVIGVPYPKIKWFKDWHPLSESSRIHIKQEEPDTCVLTLNDAILKDGGLYTCTATNVGGTATTSAMLSVEECENEYHILTYKRPPFTKPNERPFEDFYDIGDELGRGTQGITYHVVERKTGKSLAAKVMHGTDKLMDFMTAEMDIMNQLCHPRLVRLWNAHNTNSSLTLATDLCGGGELLPNIIHQDKLTESIVAHYIKQILEGLQHMHEKNIAHLGLTIGDILLTRLNCDNIKIADFGLATRLHQGREFIQEYGHPEFVAPEIANKLPVTLAADMWSVGIIAYILLVGESPFLRENDRATLNEVQKGKPDFYHEGFAELSDDARDFVTQLLQFDPSQRMDVNAALKHKWIGLDSLPDMCDELNNIDRLRDYHKKWRSWYANASCRWFFRRRTLESCFTHPSRMIYPPSEEYTPPSTPERDLDRTRVKPAAFDDVTYRQRIEREAIDPRSESHYQNGPDTFLLPLRDPDFPVRIRRYLKVGAGRSPMLASHLKEKHWGYSDVAVKERRKFVDVMDEEIDDEKKGLSRSATLRQRHEVGTVGSGYDHIESRSQKKRRGFRGSAGTAPYFREKIKHAVVRENEDAVFQCRVTADPEAQVSWFRNDGILIESSRIIINKWSDGRCSLTLRPAKAYDVGAYKCVARNVHGISICRARLNLGSASAKPDPPKAEKCSDTEIFLTWMPPKFDGFSPTFGYALEYREEGTEAWTKLANNIAHEFYLVRNLSPATTYYFHLCAVNKFGWSEFSVQSEPILTLAESSAKIELGRAEKFQQDQTDSGNELILETIDQVKLDYEREEEPLALEEAEPTELYNYISEIAKGRFSLVMKVWHKKLNTTFIAKALDLTGSNGQAAHREFEIYNSLQHEKIANLHSASVSKTSMFFVMEKLSGIDVISYLSMRQLYTEETVSKIIHQVIDALEYLHFRGICYFELQPDNIIMEDKHHPNIKLVDFGSAQYVPEEGAKVQVNGCTEYLAPEILKGEDVHTPADIWGVGVLTYILLSGVSPFVGDSEKETKDNVLYVRYHFDHLYKEVTPEATHFLMQLFKRTPQKRPTAEECQENKWLLPNEYMIKKREHAVFQSHTLKEFSEHFHSLKAKATPTQLLNIFGKGGADTR